MEALWQDLRLALRGLRKTPGFAVIAVLTLALGIGANTAIFSVINAVLLRPLPYRHPERLVTVEHLYPSLNHLQAPVSAPGFRDYRAQIQLFEQVAVEDGWVPSLTGRGDPERVPATRVSGDYFLALGVPAMVGRTLRPDEARAGSDKVVVLSYGFWQRVFGGDRAVLGQKLTLNAENYEVVGVMPAGFRDFWARTTDLWSPLVIPTEQFGDDRRTSEYLALTAALRPGVTLDRAQTELHALAARLKKDYPNSYPADWNLVVTPLREKATGGIRTALMVLLGAVGFVLLIACANVANLQLARAAARSREIAVRLALGATSRHLIRQLLSESVLLALLGGALGLLFAVWSVPALVALNHNLPGADEIRPDATVLGFTLLVSILTGLLFGLAPALHLVRTNLQATLKEGGRGSSGAHSSLALRRGLVIATVALALTLLAGAGLLLRSFARLQGVDPGFSPDHLLTFNVALPETKYPSDTVQAQLFDRLTSALATLPGVAAVGGTTTLPFGGGWSTGGFSIEGYQTPPNQPGPWGDQRAVTPGFFTTLKIPLLEGRFFDERDRMGAPGVAIVDQELARRYWPKEDPVGKRLTFDDIQRTSAPHWLEVVGVVGHTLHEGLDGQTRVQVYVPFRQQAFPSLNIAVRSTGGDPLALLGTVSATVKGMDADLPLSRVRTMEQLIDASTGPRRFSMLLLLTFSGIALTLASIGLYGVMSYTVAQRAQELGIRLALGAAARDVLGLVMKQGMRLALIGVGIGLAASLAVTRLLRTMVFGIGTTDPLTFGLIPLVLLGVTLIATYVPARRATRVDPMIAIRTE